MGYITAAKLQLKKEGRRGSQQLPQKKLNPCGETGRKMAAFIWRADDADWIHPATGTVRRSSLWDGEKLPPPGA